ncbi:MAG: cyclic pyranopterin monophosphate synthase MoaC [Planctomycetota bacterium]|nr:cyclic pyranopterin monophosphate synthase MoaC [Planctomycetota bacterium]
MSQSSPLSHVDSQGRAVMVDVGGKEETPRQATASAQVLFPEGLLARVMDGDLPKGAVIEVARIAGIQAAKRTADLIPMCHPLALDTVEVRMIPHTNENVLEIQCTCKMTGKTGVEMEAMVGASLAALTIFDMTKAMSKGISIQETRLLQKSGGKSGPWTAQ